MDSSGKKNNWDETMHSSNNYPAFHKFACSDKDIAIAARYPTEFEEICEWITTRQKRAHENQLQSNATKEADADVMSDAPYRHIADPYETRILEIHPGNFSDNLKGTLHYCSLEYEKEKPRANSYELQYYSPTNYALSSVDLSKPIWYTALSYTWGEPDPTTDAAIECGGYKIKITHSLETALRYFRQSDRFINMWVDQICIDQSNNKEKEQQIPLMSKIYGHAASTVIWLGEATEGSVEAFELLQRLGTYLEGPHPPQPDEFERVFLSSATDLRWRHLWDLLNRKWFTRLWIVQEVILSQNAWVICGKTELYWERFVQCLQVMFYSDMFAWLQHVHGGTSSDNQAVGWSLARLLANEYSFYHVGKQGPPDLSSILPAARDAQASDLRDKIYGLLGLCSLTGIEVSYDDSTTAACVYRTATIACIKESGLSIILCSIDHEPELEGLPSWVPDWSLSRETDSLGCHPTFCNFYAATGTLFPHLHPQPCTIRPDGKTLVATGKLFDVVRDTGEVCSRPDITREDPLNSNQHVVAWIDMAQTCHPYPSGCKLFDAFWRTLVANRNGEGWQKSPSSYSEIFSLLLDESTGRSPSLPDQTYSPRQLRPKGRGKLELANLAARAPSKLYQEILTALRRAMRNRRLGTTEKGYLGLVPRQAKSGDVICILNGCHVPLVLRKAEDDTLKVVGECYVHGIMDGEVVAMEDVPWTSVIIT